MLRSYGQFVGLLFKTLIVKAQRNFEGYLDQVNFVEVQLVIRSILDFSLIKNYEIFAVLPLNLLDLVT